MAISGKELSYQSFDKTEHFTYWDDLGCHGSIHNGSRAPIDLFSHDIQYLRGISLSLICACTSRSTSSKPYLWSLIIRYRYTRYGAYSIATDLVCINDFWIVLSDALYIFVVHHVLGNICNRSDISRRNHPCRSPGSSTPSPPKRGFHISGHGVHLKART